MPRALVEAEIFAVGDELCYGRVYDTNSFWLADQVTKLGLIVKRITCIRDSVEGLSSALMESLARSPRFIFISGGLGPTADDRTIEAISKVVGREIVTEEDILRKMAETKGVTVERLSPGLKAMARTVEGASCYPNPIGWAPVTLVTSGKTLIAALPGPPKEMKSCFMTYLSKGVADVTGYRSLSRRIFVSMYESEISPLLEDLRQSFDGTYFKPLAGQYKNKIGLPVEIIVFSESERMCEEKYTQLLTSLRHEITKRGKVLLEDMESERDSTRLSPI